MAGTLYMVFALSSGTARAGDDRHDGDEIDRLREEASATLLRGQFDRARAEFEKILKLVPNDASAQRDAARAAQAAGQFEYSARALERAHHFEDHKADPEIHYLRGEALYTLDRPEEAAREHRIAELEIGPNPTDRMHKLWLARVYARRGWLVQADRLYDPLWPAAPAKDSEVALNQADGHLLNQDWEGGEGVLRRYLEREPKSIRAREMLAWALEASSKLDAELVVRQSLVEDAPTADNKRDYGRALERAASYRAARDQYHAAIAAGAVDRDGTLVASYSRMRFRTTPELMGGGQFRTDPQAWSVRVQAGAALPFGTRQLFSLLLWHDRANDWAANLPNTLGDNTLRGSGSLTGLAASVLLATRNGASLLAGGDARMAENRVVDVHGVVYRQSSDAGVGAFGEGLLPLLGMAEVNVRGDLNEQWAEAPITIHEGGKMTGATGHLFLFPKSRTVVFDLGVQRRLLTIDAQTPGAPLPEASQQLYFGGIDFNLWASARHQIRNESLDDRLVRRTYLTDAGILAYRHYELFTEKQPDFRIDLAPRASIDNVTLTIRKVLADGRFAFDLHGGLGYDNKRLRALAQGGLALVLTATWSSRMLVSYDVAHETATGIPGTLHIAWLSYHMDL